jgi:FG-GAP-like repeat
MVVLVALSLVSAAAAAPPPPVIVTGLDAGWPDVRGWNANGSHAQQFAPWGEWPLAFSAYPTYQDGVRVAVGDVNGDGRPEIITAPGNNGFTELKVFDGRSFRQLNTVLPFKDAAWWAGAYVAAGDTNGDGKAEIVDGLGPACCTTLHVVDATSGNELSGFFPYGNNSQVGARVAAADVNGDGKAELIAEPIGTSRISIYAPSGGAAIRTIDAFGSEAQGPTTFAAGDVAGDARAEIVAAAATYSGPQVKVFDPSSGATSASLFPYGAEYASSVEVALGDVDGDGHNDIITSATTADGTEVKAVDLAGHQLADFYVLDPGLVPGASLAAGDLDGDGKAEIVLGGGPTTAPWPPTANGPDQEVAVYKADGTAVGHFTAYPGLFQGGVRVALADLDGDQRPELVTAPGPGIEPEVEAWSQQWVNGRDRGTRLGHFLAFESSFRGGVSVATGDVNGDGNAEIVAAPGPGHSPEVRVFDSSGHQLYSFLAFGADYTGGLSVATGDVDGDGKAEIVVGTLAAPARIRVFKGRELSNEVIVPFGPSASGVEVGVADFNGLGYGDVIAGSASGDHAQLALIDPVHGRVDRRLDLGSTFPNGVRVAGGDLNQDGHDEVVVTPGFGGDSSVRIYGSAFSGTSGFPAYDWAGAGMNVAVETRIGMPLAAFPRTVKLTARKRTRVTVARFYEGTGASGTLRARVAWGDGSTSRGLVLSRPGGFYDVQGAKRYARPGRYSVTVTMTAGDGRISIARSKAVVSRRR